MTTLVTGGSGFLGSHVVERLARAGRPVRALVRKTSDTKFLKSLPNVELAEGAVDDADVPSGSAYHFDDGAVHTMEELIRLTETAMGQRARFRFPLPRRLVATAALGAELYGKATNQAVMLTRDKLNELFEQWVCDSSRARRELGWKPEVSFDVGITRTVAWYREAGWL